MNCGDSKSWLGLQGAARAGKNRCISQRTKARKQPDLKVARGLPEATPEARGPYSRVNKRTRWTPWPTSCPCSRGHEREQSLDNVDWE